MGKPLRVLSVEDSDNDAALLRRHLARAGYDLTFARVETAEALAAALERRTWDVVLADYVMPHFSAPDALALLQQRGVDLPFIIVSGAVGEETAVAAMRAGAHDFIMKSNLTRLVPAIERELHEAETRRERRRAEEALRESEERFRTLAEEVRLIAWQADARSWRFTYVGRPALDILGYPPEAWYTDGFWVEHLHPEDRTWAVPYCLDRSAHLDNYEFEYRMLAADGRTVWLRDMVNVTRDESGPKTLRGFLIDITDRKRAEAEREALLQEVSAERRRLRTVLEQIPEGVLIADAPDGRFSLWNRAAEQVVGLPLAGGHSGDYRFWRLDGQPWSLEDLPLERALWRGETVLGVEVAAERPDGRRVILLVNAAPIRNGDGRISAAVATFQNITERKTVEQFKDEFLSLAAHELKTPLTAIRGGSQLLLRQIARKRSTIGGEETHLLQMIAERTQYAARLVEELLDLSRAEAGRLELHRSPTDLAELLHEVVAQQRELHDDYPFVLDGAELPVPGSWDPGRLEQVFTNLLDNAVKYSAGGSPVRVTLSDGGRPDTVHVAVQDQGMGIPARDLPHLFERHFRASNVNRASGGLGLGLYISRQIIERHGGRIWAESAEGEGSTFHVVLPLEGPAASADGAESGRVH